MKYLIYIINLLSLFSCIDKKNIQDVRSNIKQDLNLIHYKLQKEIQKKTDKQVERIRKVVKTGKRKEKLEIFLKRSYKLKQKYLEVMKLLTKSNTHQMSKKIYKDNIKWLNKISKEYKIGISFFEDNTELEQFLAQLDSKIIKEQLGISISHNFEEVMGKIGMFPYIPQGGFTRRWLVGLNNIEKVEEGRQVELMQVFLNKSITISERYDHILDIDKGNIQEKDDVFYISIPTQKLGRQEFKATLLIRNWKPNKDTTIKYTQTFKVIK